MTVLADTGVALGNLGVTAKDPALSTPLPLLLQPTAFHTAKAPKFRSGLLEASYATPWMQTPVALQSGVAGVPPVPAQDKQTVSASLAVTTTSVPVTAESPTVLSTGAAGITVYVAAATDDGPPVPHPITLKMLCVMVTTGGAEGWNGVDPTLHAALEHEGELPSVR
jgi:hypothetical protein